MEVRSRLALESNLQLKAAELLTSVVTADQNDWTLATGAEKRVLIGARADRHIHITGIALTGGNVDGQIVFLRNASSANAVLSLMHADTGSAAANRFSLPNSDRFLLWPGQTVVLRYVGSSALWTFFAAGDTGLEYQHTHFDDFHCGTIETGEGGERKWSFTNGSFTYVPPSTTTEHGIMQRLSSGTIAQFSSLFFTAAATRFDRYFETAWRMAMNATSADFTIRFGMMDQLSLQPVNGIYIERLSTDTSFFAVARNTGVETRTALVAQDTNYRTFRIQRRAAAAARFLVNNGTLTDIATNVPADSSGLFDVMQIIPTVAASRTANIDFYRVSYLPQARNLL